MDVGQCLQQMAGDMSLPASGLREVAVATGILGVGVKDGCWNLDATDTTDPTAGAIRVNSAAASAKMFFAANSQAALRLRAPRDS